MNTILSTLSIGQEKCNTTCCIEYSIVHDGVVLSFLHSFIHSIHEKTTLPVTCGSTRFNTSKKNLERVFSDVPFSLLEKSSPLCLNRDSLNLILLDSIDPFLQDANGNMMNLRDQIAILKKLLSFQEDEQSCIIILLPEELGSQQTRDAVIRFCQLRVNLSETSCVCTLSKPSGKVIQYRYTLESQDHDMILNEMKTSSDMETRSATDARGYAESISIIQSSMNRAPELVIEEDEMDEDGDEDDPIDDDLDI
ncbi:hypothetical protein WA171_001388 [Blastocystis sp. BT1]